METQNELGKAKQQMQKWAQLRKEQANFVNYFGEQVCKTLNLSREMIRMRADEFNVKEYLTGIMELIV